MGKDSATRTHLDTESLEMFTTSPVITPVDDDEYKPVSLRRWYHEIPLALSVLLVLLPQPSVLYVLVNYHWRVLQSRLLFATHLLSVDLLTFLTLSSLMVCIVRDPGPVVVKDFSSSNTNPTSPSASRRNDVDGTDEEMDLTEALMATDDYDFSAPGKWCRKCWAPKPERAHHCSTCGRCVLKQDHHCPWLGSRCIGHRTYPAFVHFLTSITLLSIYVSGLAISGFHFALYNTTRIDAITPVHEIFLAFYGLLFALVVGSFLIYHLYLILTNQTTIEHLNPFLMLRHLPPLPPSGHSLSDPPLEPELTYTQRRIVKDAHRQIRMYDLGWKENWAQVFGLGRSRRGRNGSSLMTVGKSLLYRVWLGGSTTGNGLYYPRNPNAERMLGRLADELVKADKDRL